MMTRQETERARQAARAKLERFLTQHQKVLSELRRLEQAERKLTWPPPGYEECSGEHDDGSPCEATFPQGQMPAGWTENQFTCGCGGSGSFFCPVHAGQTDGRAGRCSDCSR